MFKYKYMYIISLKVCNKLTNNHFLKVTNLVTNYFYIIFVKYFQYIY